MSVSQVTTRQGAFAEDVLACQQAGLQALGVWRYKLLEFGLGRAVELLRDTGTAVSSLSSTGGFTGSDGYSFNDSVLEARQAVREAIALKAHCLVVVTGGRWKHTGNHARRIVIDALRHLAQSAGDRGLSIALQPLRNPDGCKASFLHTLDATLDVLHQTDRPQVGLVFDFFELAEEVELASRIPEITPLVKLVKIGDRLPTPEGPVRCMPGEGTLPIADWIERLEAAGYRGPYEIYVPSSNVWERSNDEIVRASAAALRSFLPGICDPSAVQQTPIG